MPDIERKVYNPEVSIDGESVQWKSKKFYELLMGKARTNKGGMQVLKILSMLWYAAPNIVLLADMQRELGGLQKNGCFQLLYGAGLFIESDQHPLSGLVKIENIRGHGYRLTPVEQKK